MAIIRNITTGPSIDVPVNDLGITVHIAEDFDLGKEPAEDVARSTDLPAAITADQLIYLDSQGNPLTKQESLDAQASISSTTPAIVLQDDGTNVAGTPHSKVNFASNLSVTNDGNGVATITAVGAGAADLATVTVGLSGNITIPLAFTNILWPVTHVENDITVVEHDNTNTDRILIKETGTYFVNFAISFDADAGEETIQARVLIDDTTVVPGSLRTASEDDEINDLSNAITAELTAGTYLTLQHIASGAGNVTHSTSNFCVTRAKGAKGDTGPAGPPGTEAETPAVQARRTTVLNDIPLTWTDLDYDVTDVENDSSVVEHLNPTTDDRIEVKETGLYEVKYCLSADDEVQGRVRVNDSTVIPGSTQTSGDPGDINNVITPLAVSVLVNLTINDFLTVQIQAATTAENLQVDALFSVKRLKGSKGDTGAAGNNMVNLEDEGTPVANTPHDTLNFTGNAAVTDSGGGTAEVAIMRPTFAIWAEENSSVSVAANNYEYSFGNGAVNTTPNPPGIPMGVACTLIAISISARNAIAGTSSFSVSVTNNGSVVATGGVASGGTQNAEVKNTTQITPDTVNFAVGDTLQFLTASAAGTLDDVRVVAWFERTA